MSSTLIHICYGQLKMLHILLSLRVIFLALKGTPSLVSVLIRPHLLDLMGSEHVVGQITCISHVISP